MLFLLPSAHKEDILLIIFVYLLKVIVNDLVFGSQPPMNLTAPLPVHLGQISPLLSPTLSPNTLQVSSQVRLGRFLSPFSDTFYKHISRFSTGKFG